MENEIELKTGKEYPIISTLEDESYGILNNVIYKAFYVGKKSITTPWYLEQKNAEGNIFASIVNGTLNLFCTGSMIEKGTWYCDGDDEPCYFAGITADNKTKKIKLSKLEEEYLINQINKWNLNKN